MTYKAMSYLRHSLHSRTHHRRHLQANENGIRAPRFSVLQKGTATQYYDDTATTATTTITTTTTTTTTTPAAAAAAAAATTTTTTTTTTPTSNNNNNNNNNNRGHINKAISLRQG